MEYLGELLNELNDKMRNKFINPRVKYYGEAHLQERETRDGSQTFPVVNTGDGKGVVISPNSKTGLITYHRVTDTTTDSDPERGYGRHPWRIKIYTIRNVWIGHRSHTSKKDFELNDGLLNEVLRAFPSYLSGKQIIRVTDTEENKISVLNEEFEGVKTNHLSLDLFAFWIEYEMRSKLRC